MCFFFPLVFFFFWFQVIDLKTQLKYYKKVQTWLRSKLGKVEAEITLSKAVYLFSIGTNDYTSIFVTNSTVLNSYSKSEYVGIVIGNLTTIVKVSCSYSISLLFLHMEKKKKNAGDRIIFILQFVNIVYCDQSNIIFYMDPPLTLLLLYTNNNRSYITSSKKVSKNCFSRFI